MTLDLKTTPGASGPARRLGLAAVLLLLLAPLGAQTPPPGEAALPAIDLRRDAVVEAVGKVLPSVVNIATEEVVEVNDPWELFRQEFFGGSQKKYNLGSGVIIDDEGYILTNFHVVKNARVIMVRLHDGRELQAEGVFPVPWSDVAVLKIRGKRGERFPAVPLAREDDLLLGETVLALGNPFGLGGSVSRGILSSKNRRPPREGETLDFADWLQTDAAINPGNSGGPLVNLKGEVIGLNVAVLKSGQGIGFAIPVKHIYEALSLFFTPEHFGQLLFGARFHPRTLEVTRVESGTPAQLAGLQPGDRLLRVNGKAPADFLELNQALVANGPNPVRLEISREGKARELQVRLIAEKTFFNHDLIQRQLGLAVREVRREEAADLQIAGGLLIREVDRQGPAAAAGLEPGMVIVAIDGQQAVDIPSAAKLVHQRRSNRLTLTALFARQSRRGVVSLYTRDFPVRVRS